MPPAAQQRHVGMDRDRSPPTVGRRASRCPVQNPSTRSASACLYERSEQRDQQVPTYRVTTQSLCPDDRRVMFHSFRSCRRDLRDYSAFCRRGDQSLSHGGIFNTGRPRGKNQLETLAASGILATASPKRKGSGPRSSLSRPRNVLRVTGAIRSSSSHSVAGAPLPQSLHASDSRTRGRRPGRRKEETAIRRAASRPCPRAADMLRSAPCC
jgi:hypothetical protein